MRVGAKVMSPQQREEIRRVRGGRLREIGKRGWGRGESGDKRGRKRGKII